MAWRPEPPAQNLIAAAAAPLAEAQAGAVRGQPGPLALRQPSPAGKQSSRHPPRQPQPAQPRAWLWQQHAAGWQPRAGAGQAGSRRQPAVPKDQDADKPGAAASGRSQQWRSLPWCCRRQATWAPQRPPSRTAAQLAAPAARARARAASPALPRAWTPCRTCWASWAGRGPGCRGSDEACGACGGGCGWCCTRCCGTSERLFE
jgi:hypothetical protein